MPITLCTKDLTGRTKEMIYCRCHTNINQHKLEEWPETLCCRPVVGDCIRSRSGILLKVCRITHAIGYVPPGIPISSAEAEEKVPFLRIELTKLA